MENKSDLKKRLFIAIYPKQALVDKIFNEIKDFLPSHGRLVDTDQVHMTVSFLGDIALSEISALKHKLKAISKAQNPFEIQTLKYCFLPSDKKPRLLALCCCLNNHLAELYYQCEQLKRQNEQNKKSFLPHITLCRFRQKVSDTGLPSHQPISFEVNQLRLMSSELLPKGAVHHCLTSHSFS